MEQSYQPMDKSIQPVEQSNQRCMKHSNQRMETIWYAEVLLLSLIKVYYIGPGRNDFHGEYMHPSVLRFCLIEPFVPLRDASKRERLIHGNIFSPGPVKNMEGLIVTP